MSDERQVNIPLLRKAVEWVEEQQALEPTRREWFQYEWVSTSFGAKMRAEYANPKLVREYLDAAVAAESCGTVRCVAGYIGALSAPEFENKSRAVVGGVLRHVAEYAAEQLGISYRSYDCTADSGHLFSCSNTAADVRRIAEELAGEKL